MITLLAGGLAALLFLVLFLVFAVAAPYFENNNKNKRHAKVIGTCFLFSIFAVGLYLKIGNMPGLLSYWAAQKQQQQLEQFRAQWQSPQEVVDALKAHLEQHPERARGWFLLGKLYFHQQNWPEAQRYLQRAVALKPKASLYAFYEVQAAFFAAGNHFTKQNLPRAKILLKDKRYTVILSNLFALEAYQKHDYPQAIHYWRNVLAKLPEDSPEAKAITEAIVQAQQKTRTQGG